MAGDGPGTHDTRVNSAPARRGPPIRAGGRRMTDAERRARGKRLGRVLIEIWKRDRCTRCSRRLPHREVVLHHRPGTDKRFNIGDWSQRPTRSLATLAAELRKTDPCCHGCHADEHREENRQRANTARRDTRGRFLPQRQEACR